MESLGRANSTSTENNPCENEVSNPNSYLNLHSCCQNIKLDFWKEVLLFNSSQNKEYKEQHLRKILDEIKKASEPKKQKPLINKCSIPEQKKSVFLSCFIHYIITCDLKSISVIINGNILKFGRISWRYLEKKNNRGVGLMEEAHSSRLYNMLTSVIIIKLGCIRYRNKFKNLECILLHMKVCYLKKVVKPKPGRNGRLIE